MALSNTYSTVHFVTRLLGVTGLFAGVIGLVLWMALGVDEGRYVALAGCAALLIALLAEVPGLRRTLTSRRGAVGSTVALQVALASMLLAGVNLFSFLHYQRIDLTSERIFTLKRDYRDQLAKLDQDTTIVVYQRHTAFGQSPENPPDNYDAAAQRKIIEKVTDLAELFQDLGPRFRVELLDSYDDNFEERLNRYKKESPKLAEAIGLARENSIFFHANVGEGDNRREYVQTLGFNDVFQLDKEASYGGKEGRNLVLRDQGIDAFVGKVLNIQQKRPRIGFAVAHEWLGVEGDPFWAMGGVKRILHSRGMDYQDIVLKRFTDTGPPTAAVLTREETRYEQCDSEIGTLEKQIEDLDRTLKIYGPMERDFGDARMSLADLNRKYFYCVRPGNPRPDIYSDEELKLRDLREGKDYIRVPDLRISAETRQTYLERIVAPEVKEATQLRELVERRLGEVKKEMREIDPERVLEQKRVTDLKARLGRLLADCDMLVLSRFTIFDVFRGRPISYELHKLEEAQVEAIRDFIKAGKPVLFCLDPAYDRINEADEQGDGIDRLLAEVRVRMPVQAVIFDVESDNFIRAKGGGLELGRLPDAPPLLLHKDVVHSAPAGKAWPAARGEHPIRTSLRLAANSINKESPRDLWFRNPRPIYYVGEVKLDARPEAAAAAVACAMAPHVLGAMEAAWPLLPGAEEVPDASAVFLSTDKNSWNQSKPFPEDDLVPRFVSSSPGDPDHGTWKQRRRGPFPVAVAFNAALPPSWYEGRTWQGARTRLAVIGDAEAFKAENLSPMKEKLLLDVSSWLMGRDDLLSRETEKPWSFLRISMTEPTRLIWAWSMWLGLPLVFIYLGTIVMLKRRLR